jgi:hypothetical protein
MTIDWPWRMTSFADKAIVFYRLTFDGTRSRRGSRRVSCL